MQTQELIQQSEELRQLVTQAKDIAEKLQAQLPEFDEPAMLAQCSVLRTFLLQAEKQEERFSDMLKAKMQG
ncbi:MAG: hypothetical protein MRZ79_25295 [Bacteroidia bacterium]|nr:hypothetical protein [Bacteroidia bacterium]